MSKQRIVVSTKHQSGVSDVPQFKQYLDRMSNMKRRVFHDGRWWNDPQELKRELKL